MEVRITIDVYGRILLSISLRERMRVETGDNLLIEAERDIITLRPLRREALLKKEFGIWVYQGETSTTSIPKLE